ncbi:hypothetical protein PR048_029092 [Dryococelus australis]|uniref:UBC core domain-containing protein n=1 Tax=Dryococelus australis TaxID=614101 RepID=A0ABQ9GCG8_9NEOP|nr:hypothetical protein PR048_029092 [Dryococelus australis]
MTASKRLGKELSDIRSANFSFFKDIHVDESNLYIWKGLILPNKPPYCKGAFKIEINFPEMYPFKPPKITFITKIYHPNIDEKGQVCLPTISPEGWKPSVNIITVIEELLKLIDEPEVEHALRADLAEEYLKNRKKFLQHAEEHAKKNAEKRS